MNSTKNLNESYWNSRYQSHSTTWDLTQISPPLKAYFDQLSNKNCSILIPGCGNSYEADYLLQQGFTDITLIDIAPNLVEKLQMKFGQNPLIKIIAGDFFTLFNSFDLIVEQTFFCALDPIFREKYVQKIHSLLKPQGKLVGLLFNRDFEGGPPFGGTKIEYAALFTKDFILKTFELCNNSHVKRKDSELFINFIRN